MQPMSHPTSVVSPFFPLSRLISHSVSFSLHPACCYASSRRTLPIFSTGLPEADVRSDPLVSRRPPSRKLRLSQRHSLMKRQHFLLALAPCLSLYYTHINSSVQETMQSRSSLLFCFRSASHVRFVPLPPPRRVFRLSSFSWLVSLGPSKPLISSLPPFLRASLGPQISADSRGFSLSRIPSRTCMQRRAIQGRMNPQLLRHDIEISEISEISEILLFTHPPRAYFITCRSAKISFREHSANVYICNRVICIRNRCLHIF